MNRARTVRPRIAAVALTFEKLSKHFADGESITIQALVTKGLVRGTLDKKLKIQKGIELSADARAAVLAAGGSIG